MRDMACGGGTRGGEAGTGEDVAGRTLARDFSAFAKACAACAEPTCSAAALNSISVKESLHCAQVFLPLPIVNLYQACYAFTFTFLP